MKETDKEKINMLLSNLVTELRIEKGWNQKEMAKHFKVSEDLIIQIESAELL